MTPTDAPELPPPDLEDYETELWGQNVRGHYWAAAKMRAYGQQCAATHDAEVARLKAEVEGLRKDAERYRHASAYGWPMRGPQCIAWTSKGDMVLGDTPEAALDSALQQGERP